MKLTHMMNFYFDTWILFFFLFLFSDQLKANQINKFFWKIVGSKTENLLQKKIIIIIIFFLEIWKESPIQVVYYCCCFVFFPPKSIWFKWKDERKDNQIWFKFRTLANRTKLEGVRKQKNLFLIFLGISMN